MANLDGEKIEVVSNSEERVVESVELTSGVKKVVRREKPAEARVETVRPKSIKELRGEISAEMENRSSRMVGGSSASSGRDRKPKWR